MAKSQINQKDVAKSLRSEGISTAKADSLAQAITARLNGQELTKAQRSILSFELGNPPVQRVISEFIKKKTDRIDSTQNNVYDEIQDRGRFSVLTKRKDMVYWSRGMKYA